MTIGERIKNRRSEIGMSVDELASMIGKNRATIYRYENEDIENLPVSILEPLAKALRVTPAELLGWNIVTGKKENLSFALYESEKDKLLLNEFHKLNDVGQTKLIEHAIMMNVSGLYTINYAARSRETDIELVSDIDSTEEPPETI